MAWWMEYFKHCTLRVLTLALGFSSEFPRGGDYFIVLPSYFTTARTSEMVFVSDSPVNMSGTVHLETTPG